MVYQMLFFIFKKRQPQTNSNGTQMVHTLSDFHRTTGWTQQTEPNLAYSIPLIAKTMFFSFYFLLASLSLDMARVEGKQHIHIDLKRHRGYFIWTQTRIQTETDPRSKQDKKGMTALASYTLNEDKYPG